MNTMTAEAANEYLRRFLEDDDPLEQSPYSEDNIPWEEKRPLSWSEFFSILRRYCEHRGWEFLSDGPGDFSLAIFAHEDQGTDGMDAFQGRLPFEEEDALPF